MERMIEPLAVSLRDRLADCKQPNGLYRVPREVRLDSLLSLVGEVMGQDLTLFRSGEMLLWDVARHEGYNIPSYPVANSKEVRAFLASYGASDVPEWYKMRGVSYGVTDKFYQYACIMARNARFWRKIVVVPALELVDAGRLAPYLIQAIDFCLGDDTDQTDPTLFKC